ncbi:MAG: hypothetical protein PVSMB8_10150 [Vulcanimicrobiaceae bacterium]
MGTVERREIVAGDRAECGRDLDADDPPERMHGRKHHHATHPRAYIDERRVVERERNQGEQRVEIADRRRLVVRRVRDARTDRVGVEFAQEEQRLGRDAVLGVETLAGAPSGHAKR